MSWREIRVRPVVRYIVTEFTCDEKSTHHKGSIEFGEFNNVERANTVANALSAAKPNSRVSTTGEMNIYGLRAGEDKIRWYLQREDEL